MKTFVGVRAAARGRAVEPRFDPPEIRGPRVYGFAEALSKRRRAVQPTKSLDRAIMDIVESLPARLSTTGGSFECK